MCNSSDGKWRDAAGEFRHIRLPVFHDRGRPNSVQEHVYPGRDGGGAASHLRHADQGQGRRDRRHRPPPQPFELAPHELGDWMGGTLQLMPRAEQPSPAGTFGVELARTEAPPA